MTEPRLSAELTSRFSRVATTALTGFTLLFLLLFILAAETTLRRSLDRSAEVVETLVAQYADSAVGTGMTVQTGALADQLVSMGGQVAITRTSTGPTGSLDVYYLSPGMPAKRLEGLPATAGPEDVRRIILAAIAARSPWRFHLAHRRLGPFDIYVVGSREPYLTALLGLVLSAAVLLPLVLLLARRGARGAVARALGPLARVTETTRAIGPRALGRRIPAPTGQAEVTDLVESLNRMLERVDRAHRALESFTADASHELRTPLTHLRAQVQWALSDGRTGPEMRDALGAMEAELDRTAKLIEDLLLIARGENRLIPFHRQPFDVGAVVREVEEITQAMCVGRDLTVEAGLPSEAWAAGDPDRTRHILLNLATNAVRYTPQGRIRFGVRCRDGAVQVAVTDTGPGIPPELADRVFDRFFRIEPSRSRALGGTGLGLAIARVLAELQGGTVTVEPGPDGGSSFILSLPAVDPMIRAE